MTRSRSLILVVLLGLAGRLSMAQTGLPLLSQPIPDQVLNRGTVEIDLRNYFGLPGVTGPVAQFTTSVGKVNVELRSAEAPQNVGNFLSYVTKRAYDNTFVHRVDNLGAAVPAAVYGGAYVSGNVPPVPASVTRSAPVPLEYGLPNTRGTLAAYHPFGSANGATSEWFFNVLDNSAGLGPGNDGGFTVFGRVLGTGMTVVDAIAQLQTANLGATALSQVPVRGTVTQGQFTPANLIVVQSVRQVPVYPPDSGDPSAVLAFAATTAVQGAGIVATSITGSTLKISPLAEGIVTLSVRAVDSNGNSSLPAVFTVTVPSGALLPPVFTTQPRSQTVAAGTTVVLGGFATGGDNGLFPLRYQWYWNGRAIPVPESPFLILRKVTAADAGVYSLVVSNALGSTPSVGATVTVVPSEPVETGRLVNLAVLNDVGRTDGTLVVGFAVGSAGTSAAKPLLFRGIGPALAQFGVRGVLADPRLTLFRDRTMLASNDNWRGDAEVQGRAVAVGAFTLPASGLDAALSSNLAPGAYTLQITGADPTGVTLAEVYDATPPATFNDATPRLVNVSARGMVDRQSHLVAGFVIGGSYPVTVMIRGIGATLGAFGVPGTLDDPQLSLYDGTRLIATNDNWGGDPQLSSVAASVGAFILGDPTSKDAVLLTTLPPGSYTAQVHGAGNDSGAALVEVYEVR